MRLRSRPVTCRMGSIPLSSIRWAAAIGAMVMLAPAESVRLKASTMPPSARASANRGPRSAPLGGLSSAVTTNLPDFSDSENLTIRSLPCASGARSVLGETMIWGRVTPSSCRLAGRRAVLSGRWPGGVCRSRGRQRRFRVRSIRRAGSRTRCRARWSGRSWRW